MSEHAGRWTEARLLGLDPYEHDFQEYKSSPFLWAGDRIRSDFLDNLSKQVSAFGNASGGSIVLGLDDHGHIDGGIPTAVRPNGTREWLEDVIPGLVDPPLKRFNVFEIPHSGHDSAIHPGHAVYVLEVPESEDAPHQARDRRYYLRIAGKSRPMAHRHVTDVLHRVKHPQVDVDQIHPFGEPELTRDDPRGPKVLLPLRATLTNRGANLAHHVGCEFILPRIAVNSDCRRRTLAQEDTRLLQRPGELTFFFYYPIPIFPGQVIPFGEVWIAIHRNNLPHYHERRVEIRWRVFADASPPREGRADLSAFSAVQRGMEILDGNTP